MSISVTIDPAVENLAVGLVEATGVTIGESDEQLLAHCREVVQRVAATGPEGGDQRRQSVRQLLRLGGFKPSGATSPRRNICCERPARTDSGRSYSMRLMCSMWSRSRAACRSR